MSKPSPQPITRRDLDRLAIPAIISGIAGRLNGERNWRDLYRVSWQVVRVGIYIGAGLGVVYTAGYPWIGGLFTTDPEVLGLFNAVFWMVILTQPINAVAFAFDGIYKGLGNGKILRNVLLRGLRSGDPAHRPPRLAAVRGLDGLPAVDDGAWRATGTGLQPAL